jgi:uncharacterized repeat protein (TIGR03803 family)
LVELNGTLYGTTTGGGTAGQGTVFSITPQGSETVLYSFQGGMDGSFPEFDLFALNGVLYGMARYGGVNGNGTVYAITPSGTFKTLHDFQGGRNDGANPAAPLTALNGQLYGNTLYGGSNNAGTFFTIGTGGTESVLHSFGSGQDGRAPFRRLLLIGARFYGITEYGGTGGQGTVYSVTPAGREHVIYAFPANGSTGAEPLGALTAVHGVLYGTTGYGGGTGCGGNGCGTVYSLTKDGAETVLYAFQGGNDGFLPSELLYEKGVFYGPTQYGGNTGCDGPGCGTVFAVTP